jgi:hypothetical protein
MLDFRPKRWLAQVLKRREANRSAAPAQRVNPDRLGRLLMICGLFAGLTLCIAASGSALHIGLQAMRGPAFMRPGPDDTAAVVDRSNDERQVQSATNSTASADLEPGEPAASPADDPRLQNYNFNSTIGFYLLLRATAEAAGGRARLLPG